MFHQKIYEDLKEIMNDDEKVKAYGVKLAIDMCTQLMELKLPVLHFYTLNLEKSVLQILEGLHLIESDDRKRAFPWKHITSKNRSNEAVRPIFWANRPKSYLQRTSTWDEFPNGRWGDSRSPAFGDLTDYHLYALHVTKDTNEKIWLSEKVDTEQDVWNIFEKYCAGKLNRLPWCDTATAKETDLIKERLVRINKSGYLTINSQPAINGISSDDKEFGWGPSGGYVYQKAYVEFFVSPELIEGLIDRINKKNNRKKGNPSLTYHAVRLNKNEPTYSNGSHQVNAVTWGVFPGQEIVQPTVVDEGSFGVWKDEAFALWNSQWLSCYDQNESAQKKSYDVLSNIINNYYLMNIVDNDYIHGDLFSVFEDK